MLAMIPRWYTSRLFSFGLAGWVMLLVWWSCFAGHTPWIGWVTADSSYGISRDPAVIKLTHLDIRLTGLTHMPRRGPWAGSGRWEDVSPEPAIWHAGPAIRYEAKGASKHILIGIWFIISIYTSVWLGGLIWWHRRKLRLMADPLGSALKQAAAHVPAGKSS